MPDPTVFAVVVTYRRTDLLKQCIGSLRNQTRPPDHVLVVDNDAQAAHALVGTAGVELIETGENLGPSGGYEVGLRAALERGAEKVWLVDDDSEPRADCLEHLLRRTRGTDVLVPLQLKPGGFRGHPPSWHGTLIDAGVIREIGFPDRRLFFSKEDSEYFWRARDRGYPWIRVPEAIVHHHHSAGRRKGQARNWRLYYEVRNHLHYWLRIRPLSVKGVLKAAKVGLGIPIVILLYDSAKIRSLSLWWWGVRDFLKGRLGKTIDPQDWLTETRRDSS
jgi:rhamnopyranosyl-N-acetylglucosaminyl-diphospho-decaprenol beta-1,3/1,4-galactofuranosyltransferase